MTNNILATIPVLASLNLADSIAFYVKKLGFVEGYKGDNYLIVARDNAAIHFWLCDERHIAENTSCYVRVSDTGALWQEFKDRGLELDPPIVRDWGMKELYVIDPHGNLLKFGEDVLVEE
jgi:catechol 2,3-dioxygenase-like lactoylglutathione lyase family enzyme